MSERPLPEHTHKAVVTIYSNGDSKMVEVRVKFEPDLEGKSIEEIGFLPMSYAFVQEFILPAIEEAYMEWQAGPLLDMESPSEYNN